MKRKQKKKQKTGFNIYQAVIHRLQDIKIILEKHIYNNIIIHPFDAAKYMDEIDILVPKNCKDARILQVSDTLKQQMKNIIESAMQCDDYEDNGCITINDIEENYLHINTNNTQKNNNADSLVQQLPNDELRPKSFQTNYSQNNNSCNNNEVSHKTKTIEQISKMKNSSSERNKHKENINKTIDFIDLCDEDEDPIKQTAYEEDITQTYMDIDVQNSIPQSTQINSFTQGLSQSILVNYDTVTNSEDFKSNKENSNTTATGICVTSNAKKITDVFKKTKIKKTTKFKRNGNKKLNTRNNKKVNSNKNKISKCDDSITNKDIQKNITNKGKDDTPNNSDVNKNNTEVIDTSETNNGNQIKTKQYTDLINLTQHMSINDNNEESVLPFNYTEDNNNSQSIIQNNNNIIWNTECDSINRNNIENPSDKELHDTMDHNSCSDDKIFMRQSQNTNSATSDHTTILTQLDTTNNNLSDILGNNIHSSPNNTNETEANTDKIHINTSIILSDQQPTITENSQLQKPKQTRKQNDLNWLKNIRMVRETNDNEYCTNYDLPESFWTDFISFPGISDDDFIIS